MYLFDARRDVEQMFQVFVRLALLVKGQTLYVRPHKFISIAINISRSLDITSELGSRPV